MFQSQNLSVLSQQTDGYLIKYMIKFQLLLSYMLLLFSVTFGESETNVHFFKTPISALVKTKTPLKCSRNYKTVYLTFLETIGFGKVVSRFIGSCSCLGQTTRLQQAVVLISFFCYHTNLLGVDLKFIT